MEIGRGNFRKEYDLLALQRNLQIIGAFCFLYKVQGKTFFKQFVEPSLQLLVRRLGRNSFADFPLLRSMADEGLQLLRW
jgi:hypothetical protein